MVQTTLWSFHSYVSGMPSLGLHGRLVVTTCRQVRAAFVMDCLARAPVKGKQVTLAPWRWPCSP